ncbi:7TM diverse intracellular signaling domain-containing protein [Lunatibacter salilacus]|uniref:7TM diverse intracellular signaling domain-containing protein n=1 Tax=Lunatibacter salilacus TaxID=2483804 RepID=UPI00131AED62|nr:7TM diverse intracellular signaling domain-containing protein [Lunatibacter salilacus]
MKKDYTNFKNMGVTLFLILIVILPVFYYLGVFGGYEGFKFSTYEYYIGDEELEKEPFDRSVFTYKDEEKINLGVLDMPLYVRVSLDQYRGIVSESPSYIEVNSPTFREVEFFRISNAGEMVSIESAGTQFPRPDKLKNPNPYFKILDFDGFTNDIVFKVRSEVPIEFDITVSPQQTFFENYTRRMVIISGYFGIMVALFLYNLILFFSIKDKVYLFYCFYILFIALAQLSLSGYSYFFLWQNPYLYEVSIIGFTTLSSFFVIPFFRLFLKTSQYFPKYEKYLYLIVFIYVIALILRLMGYVSESYFIVDINGLILVVSFISIAFIVAKRGYRSAYFFMLAWSFLLFGLVLFILNNQGVLDLGAYANLPLLAGTAIEALLLSFALADKINILKKEKEKEQHDKVEALKENERLIKEQNIYLEEMVTSRTRELELTLKNLKDTQTQLVNQEKMASLGQLTAGIAHEINNPINFVSANISPLKRDIKDILELMELYREKGRLEFSEKSKSEVSDFEDDLELDYLLDEVNQLLSGMEDGAKRTVEIVRGLKLFSRIDEQDVKEVDIHDGLDSTLILLNSSMGGRVNVKKDYANLPMVECLAGKINQVFMNIISNAVHAMLDHPVEGKNHELGLKTSQEGDKVIIQISDNGPGMPSHVRDKIFEPFFTTKPVGKGTGLGLSIVYTIIENHKGTIQVESETNVGTSFILTLPINQN